MNFSLPSLWNATLEHREQRPIEPRSHIWATEIGKAKTDVILKMRGMKPTNPPNPRSLRKFEAAALTEWIAGFVLKRVGLLHSTQDRCEHQYPGLLKVTGKCDFKTGGDKPKMILHLAELDLPDVFLRAGAAIAENLIHFFPNGLPESIVEVKSCGSIPFERYLKCGKASQNHRLQLFHYLKSTGTQRGEIVYICRDDLRLCSVEVRLDDPDIERDYRLFIGVITAHYNEGTMPTKEDCLIWDEDFGRFSANWRVAYSEYLTHLYPEYDSQLSFDNHNKPIAQRWNRVIKRKKDIAEGKTTKTGKPLTLTPNNETALKEMRLRGFNPDVLVAEFTATEEETEEA